MEEAPTLKSKRPDSTGPCPAGLLRTSPVWLNGFSHHVRHATLITMGYVQVLLENMDEVSLSRRVLSDNAHGEDCQIRDVLSRIQVSQKRILAALEQLERESEQEVLVSENDPHF